MGPDITPWGMWLITLVMAAMAFVVLWFAAGQAELARASAGRAGIATLLLLGLWALMVWLTPSLPKTAPVLRLPLGLALIWSPVAIIAAVYRCGFKKALLLALALAGGVLLFGGSLAGMLLALLRLR